MSIYKGTTPLAGIVTPHLDTRNVGQIIQSTLPLTDAGLHLLDGSLLSGDGIYSDFVTYIAQLAGSHPELFTTEADWQTSVTNYGICGKFVYNSTNNTVRLPKTVANGKYLIYSHVSNDEYCRVYSDGWCEQGNKVDFRSNQGYKSFDITFFRAMANNKYNVQVNSNYTGNTGDGTNYYTNPSNTGVSIKTYGYGYSWSVTGYTDISDLKAEAIYQYIVIANSTKTEIEVDIDQIATDLNGKADTDLSNVTNTGTSTSAGWAMPSDTYINLTLGASRTTYTAPANGYVYIGRQSSASGQYVEINAGYSSKTRIWSSAGSQSLQQTLPVRKGQSFVIGYTAGGAQEFFRFVYAEGAKEEAN